MKEVSLQIQVNPYLQYFCGYAGFDDSKPPFDSSLGGYSVDIKYLLIVKNVIFTTLF